MSITHTTFAQKCLYVCVCARARTRACVRDISHARMCKRHFPFIFIQDHKSTLKPQSTNINAFIIEKCVKLIYLSPKTIHINQFINVYIYIVAARVVNFILYQLICHKFVVSASQPVLKHLCFVPFKIPDYIELYWTYQQILDISAIK